MDGWADQRMADAILFRWTRLGSCLGFRYMFPFTGLTGDSGPVLVGPVGDMWAVGTMFSRAAIFMKLALPS